MAASTACEMRRLNAVKKSGESHRNRQLACNGAMHRTPKRDRLKHRVELAHKPPSWIFPPAGVGSALAAEVHISHLMSAQRGVRMAPRNF